MLLYQNLTASGEGYLTGYYEADPDVLKRLGAIEASTRAVWLATGNQKLMPLKEMGILLDHNKELRRLYDETAGSYLESFDKMHAPLLGWDNYFERLD